LTGGLETTHNVRMYFRTLGSNTTYAPIYSYETLSSEAYAKVINHSNGELEVSRQFSAVHSLKVGTPVGSANLNRNFRQSTQKLAPGNKNLAYPSVGSDSAIVHSAFPSGTEATGYPTFTPKGVNESVVLFNFTVDDTSRGVPQTHQFGDAMRRGDYSGMGLNCLLFELIEKKTGVILDYIKLYPSGFFAARTPTTPTRYSLTDVKLKFVQTMASTDTIPYNNNARINSTTYLMHRFLRKEALEKVPIHEIDEPPTTSRLQERRNTIPELDHAGIHLDI